MNQPAEQSSPPSRVARNTLWLYARGASTLLPLATVPYLARILGVRVWGEVVFAQSFGIWSGVLVDYGLTLSATREMARRRGDLRQVAELAGTVLGARALLCLSLLILGVICGLSVELFRAHPIYLWLAVGIAAARGLNPLWYFQGTERMHVTAGCDIASGALFAGGVFLLVRSPGEAWRVLAVQAGVAAISAAVATAILYGEVAFEVPRLSAAIRALAGGVDLFALNAGIGIYTVANPFLVGLFGTSAQVAFYGGAEKICRTSLATLGPITTSIFPRVSYLMKHERQAAGAWIGRSLLALATVGGAASLCVALFAPQIVRIALGPAYSSAAPVLRMLAPLPLLIAVSNVFGIHWMLTLDMERDLLWIVAIAAAGNVLLAALLVPFAGAFGMAIAVVLSELIVTALTAAIAYKTRQIVFMGAAQTLAASSD